MKSSILTYRSVKGCEPTKLFLCFLFLFSLCSKNGLFNNFSPYFQKVPGTFSIHSEIKNRLYPPKTSSPPSPVRATVTCCFVNRAIRLVGIHEQSPKGP